MYFPYLRGKQFELLAVRESADTLATAGFVPIIEPVRASLGGLDRALRAVLDAGGQAVVITNPRHGDLNDGGADLERFLSDQYGEDEGVRPAILLRAEHDPDYVRDTVLRLRDRPLVLIHDGFADADVVTVALGDQLAVTTNVFVDEQAGMLYRRRFVASQRILVRDGFEQKRNRDYGPLDFFSDLHITHADLGAVGYGDFLTVGDGYSDAGGPAYAVAIHLTFVDPNRDGAMFVRHFVSDSNDTPTDPARKFREALGKLTQAVESGDSGFEPTTALDVFAELYRESHFPGLGVVKKLSMIHHIETLAAFERGNVN